MRKSRVSAQKLGASAQQPSKCAEIGSNCAAIPINYYSVGASDGSWRGRNSAREWEIGEQEDHRWPTTYPFRAAFTKNKSPDNLYHFSLWILQRSFPRSTMEFLQETASPWWTSGEKLTAFVGLSIYSHHLYAIKIIRTGAKERRDLPVFASRSLIILYVVMARRWERYRA